VVLCETVGQVQFSGGPEEIELALLDSVFHPPASRVEGLGELLARLGVEDAVGGSVVDFDKRSSCRLLVA
jgi:hypothetical protein